VGTSKVGQVWRSSVADPYHVDADADPAFPFDADPDPAYQFDADPDPDLTTHFFPDLDHPIFKTTL
jgi:hypothetical protein